MQVLIRNFNLDTEAEISILTLDILNHERQKFLVRHLIWAANNHVGVQILNLSDEPEATPETLDEAKQRQYELSRKDWRKENGIKSSLGRGKKETY
jgi:hypothetical protein